MKYKQNVQVLRVLLFPYRPGAVPGYKGKGFEYGRN